MSIQRIGNTNRYRVRVYNPHGKEYRKVVHGKQAALAHEAEVRVRLSGGWNPSAGSQRFDTYAEQVLAARPLAPRTRILYERALANHLNPSIGHHRLDRITHLQLQTLLTSMTEAVARANQRVLNFVFTSAERDGLIARNPTIGLRRPKTKPTTLTLPTWDTVLAADPYIIVAATTGMRAGELMGLSSNDIDHDRQLIQVNRQRIYATGWGWHYGPVKTPAAQREIPVPQNTLDLLTNITTTTVTLPWRDGPTQTHNLYFTKDISPWIKHRIGFSAHKLRHLYTRLLESSMVPVTAIDAALGHSGHERSLAIRVYSAADEAGQQAVRDAVAAVWTK